MKTSLVVILILITCNAYAQVGRYDQPSDTTFIGGKTQEQQINRMHGRDKLIADLTSLRDSVNVHMSDKTNLGSQNITFTQRKKDIDQMINALKQTDGSDKVIEEGHTLLQEVRGELKRAK